MASEPIQSEPFLTEGLSLGVPNDSATDISSIDNAIYVDSEGNIIYPSNSSNGSQVRLSTNCSKACYDTSGNYTTSTTIYKPNNAQYGVQGAVSSGSRIDRLKYNIITKNGNSFRSAWGDEGANAGKYRGTTTPYFLKNKYQSCVNNRRNGNNKLCY